jgi:WD40 repeat protein
MDKQASPDESPPTRTDADGATVDLPEAEGLFVPGTEVGGRYRIYSRLGAGGMGEVWHAFDLKLRVDVALKALRSDLLANPRRLEMLRQEVRAAREVVSPNVCRIFDLIEIDGRELVSMEYIDGRTLLDELRGRGPLELEEARDIAAQFLAGLEAIHAVGLVHRDIKPENIMLTRTGRVVVMDFGLARQEEEGGGSVSGTPAYMAPEQAAGQTVDPRADVYSAGVVLAEMVSPGGIQDLESRKSLWEGVRSEPPQLPDSPWAPVIRKAVAKDREQRYRSAHTLTRALEDVTQRVVGAEDVTPYPGLAAFTEADAEYFFGREAEVEQMWRRLEGTPRLLGLVGPSGAGKTSFLRAGLVPCAGPGWAVLVCTPGNAVFRSLRQALVSELASDDEALRELVDVDDLNATVSAVSRWRRRHDQALLIVDQFEELFTLNPPNVQTRFAELLGRLVLEADIFVVVSMRDDFFFHCHEHEALRPLVTELTLLGAPHGEALRRALVQPATKCGYRFDDDALVEEMLSEVEGERGALPMLAFAAARLWEKRDRDDGLLTRQAYQDIGGVGGALARHAEATLDRIGAERLPVVRELFRNLVTAEGTRAVREWDELLSVFGDSRQPSSSLRASGDSSTRPSDGLAQNDGERGVAQEVLRELIDARLLTSYEVRDDDREPTRRVEIIHESLLANWPRLVRWQTQDADAAQLRDELRQAAASWDEHGRPDDRLWTGSAYREFASWRERYPGGLSEVEESFADAMTFFATRRRRRRRIAVVSGIAALLVVLAVVGTLWQRSVRETQRAEAAKLLALGEIEFDGYPTASLAHAIASLELADTVEGRLLALRALHEAPPVILFPWDEERRDSSPFFADISPSGEWIASGNTKLELRFHDGITTIPTDHPDSGYKIKPIFAADDLLITEHFVHDDEVSGAVQRWWSIPEVKEIRRFMGDRGFLDSVHGDAYFALSFYRKTGTMSVYRCPLDGGPAQVLGEMEPWTYAVFDSGGTRMAYSRGNHVFLRLTNDWDRRPRRIGEHEFEVMQLAYHPDDDRVASADTSGEVRIWSTTGQSPEPLRTLDLGGRPGQLRWDGKPYGTLKFDHSGRWLAARGPRGVALFDLAAPRDAASLRFAGSGIAGWGQPHFHPKGTWLVNDSGHGLGFWPLTHRYPWVLEKVGGRMSSLEFSPEGDWLVTVSVETPSAQGDNSQVRAFPLEGQNNGASRLLYETRAPGLLAADVDIDPSGTRVAVSDLMGKIHLLSLEGGDHSELDPWPKRPGYISSGALLAFSPDGRRFAAVARERSFAEDHVIHLWDFDHEEWRVVSAVDGVSAYIDFIDDTHLRWIGASGGQHDRSGSEAVFNLEDGSVEKLAEEGTTISGAVSSDGNFILTTERIEGIGTDAESHIRWRDLASGETYAFRSHGTNPGPIALDPTDRWVVTGGRDDGFVRVGAVSGGEPRLLIGHTDRVTAVAVSPDGQLIASASDDGSVRLWPFPDMSKPPMYTLPHDELIAKLKTLTNLRMVRDAESATGWKLDVGPFPGWETVPSW